MAAILGGGGQFPLEQWFFEMPVCTRYWTAATVITSVLVQAKVLTPFQLFYSYRAVFHKGQYWRLLTTFFYFGPLSLDLAFHIFFMQRYARMLEEASGRSPAQFTWLLSYACTFILCMAPVFSMAFLGSALSSTLVYIWGRRNPEIRLSFLGFFVFRAPFLPWVLIGFSLLLHGHIPKDELAGVVVGHIWYFFNDVYPSMYHGSRPLDPPQWWIRLFEAPPPSESADSGVEPINQDIAAAAAPEVR